MKIPKLVLIFFIISLVLKLGYGVVIYKTETTKSFSDDWDYISYANQIIGQGIWVLDISKLSLDMIAPGFPLILAILFSIFGENYLVIIILNAILGACITPLIYYAGKNIFNEKVGLFASFWTIPYFLYYRWVPRVLKEMWIFLLFPLIIYLVFLEAKKKKPTLRILLLSLLFAFFIHLDERFFVYFPFIAIIFPILNWQNLRAALMKSLIFLILVLILMVPWTIRNYKVYNRIVILTTRSEFALNLSHENQGIKKILEKHYLTKEQIDSIAKGLETYNRHPVEIERIKKGIIPKQYTKWEKWYNEFLEFWRPCRFTPGYVGNGFRFQLRSLPYNLALIFSYGILLPFFFAGIYLIFKTKNIKGIIIFGIIIIHTFIHVFFFLVRYRYRVPIDIYIIILASCGFLWIYDKLNTKRLKTRIVGALKNKD